jgi:hypothetical protein
VALLATNHYDEVRYFEAKISEVFDSLPETREYPSPKSAGALTESIGGCQSDGTKVAVVSSAAQQSQQRMAYVEIPGAIRQATVIGEIAAGCFLISNAWIWLEKLEMASKMAGFETFLTYELAPYTVELTIGFPPATPLNEERESFTLLARICTQHTLGADVDEDVGVGVGTFIAGRLWDCRWLCVPQQSQSRSVAGSEGGRVAGLWSQGNPDSQQPVTTVAIFSPSIFDTSDWTWTFFDLLPLIYQTLT